MITPKRAHLATRAAALCALLALLVALSPVGRTGASAGPAAGPQNTPAAGSERDRGKVSPDLMERARGTGDAPVGVILQLNSPAGERLNAVLNRAGVHVRHSFEAFGSKALEVPASVVEELAELPEVELVAPDRPVKVTGHVNTTTGVEGVRAQTTATGTQYTLDGTGIGIAIIDSGVYISHGSFVNATETGMIVEIGLWVLRESCRQMRGWQRLSFDNRLLTLSVNLSGKQFLQPNLIGCVKQILHETTSTRAA